MKKLLLILSLAVMCSSVARAEHFDDIADGVEAYLKEDYATALKLLRPLAEQGYASAQYNLGVMYANGEGVIQDYVLAHMWSNLAASNGNEKGSRNRDRISALMTASKISEAQDMAKDCLKKNYKKCY